MIDTKQECEVTGQLQKCAPIVHVFLKHTNM